MAATVQLDDILNELRRGAWPQDARFALKLYRSPDDSLSEIRDDELLQTVIEEIRLCCGNGALPCAAHRVAPVLFTMRARPKLSVLRLFGYFLAKVWRRLFEGILVSGAEMSRLRELKCQHPDVPLLLLPTHKSHVDYLLLSWICLRYELPFPHIAAGDNLNLPVLGSFFRHSGSFFIKRKRGGRLYRRVLQAYLRVLLRAGRSVEFFLEGGRSRSGALLPPKLGLLGIVLDMVRFGHLRDCFLVPVAIDYERTPEIKSFVRQALGAPKRKDSLRKLLSTGPAICSRSRGRVYVSAPRIITARQLLQLPPHASQAVETKVAARPRDLLAHSGDMRHAKDGQSNQYTCTREEASTHTKQSAGFALMQLIAAAITITPTAVLASTWLWSPSRQFAGTRPLSMRGDRTAAWLRLLGGRVAVDGDWARAGTLLSMHLAPDRTNILPTPEAFASLTYHASQSMHVISAPACGALALRCLTRPTFVQAQHKAADVAVLLGHEPANNQSDGVAVLLRTGALTRNAQGTLAAPSTYHRSLLSYLCASQSAAIDAMWLVSSWFAFFEESPPETHQLRSFWLQCQRSRQLHPSCTFHEVERALTRYKRVLCARFGCAWVCNWCHRLRASISSPTSRQWVVSRPSVCTLTHARNFVLEMILLPPRPDAHDALQSHTSYRSNIQRSVHF